MSNQEMVKLQTLLTKLYMDVKSVEDKEILLSAYDVLNPVIYKELSKGGM